ncbi:hypothetical protein [Parasulfitobacter algicola]|uniref:Uncharacterized protein n=1 Tax=Parasulfitobacter algicola TaxID=2614809 RepID=A0ABX2ISC7_9RHOB|nr:hypothetical protein [Sulfitobacter algicola]NSX55812.1 hypothetical protein [Sulfitobacter algicola]
MHQVSGQAVKRRRVFYIPGYDPFPPRRYRELYREESGKQAAISGYQISQTAGAAGKPYGWHVDSVIDGAAVTSDIQVLVWTDLVRSSMTQSIWATYVQLVRTAWIYIGSGALRRLTWLRKGPVIAALYPIGMLLAQLIMAVFLAYGAGRLLAMLHPLAGWVAVIVVPLVLMVFRSWDNRLYAYYLMHDYAYSAQSRGAVPPELQARMDQFRDRIAQAMHDDVDEVLVVGHSSGAHLAVSILADLIRRQSGAGPALGLLTLGQVVPMISFLPDAGELRRDLQQLSVSDALTWVDVTAPGDGCAFALCDPVAVSGAATDAQKWPLIMSAAFTKTLQPDTWAALRWKFFALHFQYLCAFDRPGAYDYFQITAGPMTLAQRFKGRTPSRSKITRVASKYTSVAP